MIIYFCGSTKTSAGSLDSLCLTTPFWPSLRKPDRAASRSRDSCSSRMTCALWCWTFCVAHQYASCYPSQRTHRRCSKPCRLPHSNLCPLSLVTHEPGERVDRQSCCSPHDTVGASLCWPDGVQSE